MSVHCRNEFAMHYTNISVQRVLPATCLAIASVILLSACTNTTGNTAASNAKSTTVSAEDVEAIKRWWPGDYDNDAQIAALKADGGPVWQKDVEEQVFGGHLPVVAHYRLVDMPAFGEHVLYVEEKTFGDNGNPYRQRFYTLKHDPGADTVSVKLWYFKDRKKYLGAWQNLEMVAQLTPDDMSPLPDNCDMFVSKTDDGRYHMKMPTRGCVFGKKHFDYQVILGPDSFWFRDRIVNAETGIVEMTAGSFTYHTLDKR